VNLVVLIACLKLSINFDIFLAPACHSKSRVWQEHLQDAPRLCAVKAAAVAHLCSCHTTSPAISPRHLATSTKSLAFLPEGLWMEWGGNEWEDWCGPEWLQRSYSAITLHHPLNSEGKALHPPQHNEGSAHPPLRSAKGQILSPPSLSAWIWFARFNRVTSLLTSIARTRIGLFRAT